MPLFLGSDDTFLPTTVDPKSGHRSNVPVPFRTDLPATSLVSYDDIQCVCPDVTHMITRCVENDLKKIAQKLVDDKHPKEKESLSRLDENLTKRDVKKPHFQFDTTTKSGQKVKTVGAVSLSGSGALTAIADKKEFADMIPDMTNLFEGVWKDEEILIGSNDNENSVKVLKQMYPSLFSKPNPTKNENYGYMSISDAAELLRESLNMCTILLRSSRTGLDITSFSKWSETYYQVLILLFGKDKGLTPYKLKMLLYPQLIESGHIITPWNHMCEGLEKSNHNANKAFQSKTMRGGGKQSTQDPLFFELQFSLLKLFRKQSLKAKQVSINDFLSKARGIVGIANQADEESKTYNDICLQPVSCASIAVGETRNKKNRFLGLYFFVVGNFGSKKNEDVQNAITEMGGTVCTKASAETLLFSHSTCPNCFVVMKDEKELRKSTDTLKESTNDKELMDVPKKSVSENAATPTGLLCRKFAGGDWKFIHFSFVFDSLESDRILDPKKYEMLPGPNVKKLQVKDVRPLLARQCSEQGQKVSAISALKSHRNKRKIEEEKAADTEETLST